MRTALPMAALLFIILFAALVIADFRWRAKTATLVAHLHARGADLATSPTIFSASAAHIDTLPAPVARYIRAALREGQPIARRWRFTQEGEFLINAQRNQWGPFTATQHVVAEPPGFVWDARIRMAPGLTRARWIRERNRLDDGEPSRHSPGRRGRGHARDRRRGPSSVSRRSRLVPDHAPAITAPVLDTVSAT